MRLDPDRAYNPQRGGTQVIVERVQTGVEELDRQIEGGFPRGSLILVTGSPGTGKTAFCARFICKGADLGEAGVYVSFAEDRTTFTQNVSKLTGRDCEKYLKQGRCSFLDFITVKEKGIQTVLNTIVSKVGETKARRLIVDSYTALAQAFEEKIEARVVTHTVLGKLVRGLGCTTILTSETPADQPLGRSVEEFVADGVLVFRRRAFENRDLREVEVAKLRGTEVKQSRYIFTLSGGFRVFPPFEHKQITKPKRFQPLPDSKTHFSTGNRQLDEILGGGYRRGSCVLIDVGENVPTHAYQILIRPTDLNFLAHGRGITHFPSAGVDPESILQDMKAQIDGDIVNKLYRVFVKKPGSVKKGGRVYVEYEGKSMKEDAIIRGNARRKLEAETGQPSLSVWGNDDYEATYGTELGLTWSRFIAESTRLGRLIISICKPAVRSAQRFKDISTYHFKLELIDGAVIMYLAKPASIAYCLEDDVSKGYHQARLTPID